MPVFRREDARAVTVTNEKQIIIATKSLIALGLQDDSCGTQTLCGHGTPLM